MVYMIIILYVSVLFQISLTDTIKNHQLFVCLFGLIEEAKEGGEGLKTTITTTITLNLQL